MKIVTALDNVTISLMLAGIRNKNNGVAKSSKHSEII